MVHHTQHSSGGAAAPASRPWRVLASKGCGSAIVEAALALAELPYERIEIDYSSPAGKAALLAHNALPQVPTVIAPDGLALSETAALVQIIDELVPGAGLLPPTGDPLRREALRWLAFFIAAVYPTFTYGDNPAAWRCDDRLRESTDAHRQMLWRRLEDVARGPWFLGARCSALDLYVAVMVRWRPGRAWFAEHTPKLHALALAVDRDPRVAGVWAANEFA